MRRIAIWNGGREAWESPLGSIDLFSTHSDVYLETWPSSGTTQGGSAFELPMPALPTVASESSSSPILNTPTVEDAGRSGSQEWADRWALGEEVPTTQQRLRTQILTLPTPMASDGEKGGPNQRGGSGDLRLSSAVQLFPTPKAGDADFGLPRTSGRPPEMSTHLATKIHFTVPGQKGTEALLKTPTSQLGVNGGSQHPTKRKAGGHGPTLADEVEHLLPTPVVTDAAGTRNATAVRSNPNSKHHSGFTLTDVLLPTPQAHDAVKGKTAEQVAAMRAKGHGVWNLNEVAENELSVARSTVTTED